MASFFYDAASKDFLDADLDMLTGTVQVRAVSDDDYTASEAHTAMSSVTAYSGTTDPTISSGKTTTNGVFDADNISAAWSSVSQDGSKTIDGLVIYIGTVPIVYIDLSSPFTPNGGDINLNWNASGIFNIGD